MTRTKKIAILAPLGLLLLIVAWQGLRFWWLRGYSTGARTGTIRKVSRKGSPVCKYVSVEMVLVGSAPGQAPVLWEFTLDDDRESGPVWQALEAGQRTAKPVTVEYRQDKGKWWACADTEYYGVAVLP